MAKGVEGEGMTAGKMHEGEADIDAPLVRRLLAAQFPQWADLPVERVVSAGTDNAIYRLGADMAVRLPRIESATGQVAKDERWLPRLAPHLPLAVPVLLGQGVPGQGYLWDWGIYRWLGGDEATMERLADPVAAAKDLAGFVRALQAIDIADGPARRTNASGRGVPLALRDAATREAIAAAGSEVDTHAVTAAWAESLAAPAWHGPPVWIHGDLAPGNLLVTEGRLSGVIDFACAGVGDPACDLLVAWNLFTGQSREAFRAEMQVDDATWLRGRGWALSVSLLQLPYYLHTNPVLVASSRHVISEVLADHARPARPTDLPRLPDAVKVL
jgi:aminoglycoside phosphotransferase (APT) family kinase protein